MIRLVLLLALLAAPAAAETLRVGPGERFAVPSQAARAAKPGDRVVIAPGTYRDCAVWRAPDLTIEAAGGGEVVIAGPICAQKGLFVIAGPRATVIGLTFRGAEFAGGNAAGIRAEGGDLRVIRSRFEGNQNGILTHYRLPEARLVIEDSVFVGNGALIHECAHGLYAGHWALVAIRQSRFEGTRICHHVKSRALATEIIDSEILDTPGNRASYLVDIPNGGNLLLRNTTLRKGPDHGNPTAAVMIGAEGVRHPTTSLRVIGNRFENLMPRGTHFVENRTTTPVVVEGNEIRGAVVVLAGPGEVR
ncbi:MAG: hypothetical protein QN147_02840 [Armatimonadota bacterium]|nr:hypothetical protein [Armatimonadota bacterium]